MKEITLTVTIDEANLILEALGEQPYKKIYALVAKIQEQATRQLKEDEKQQAPHPKKSDR